MVWQIEATRDVRATPERLWAWYEDHRSAPSWDPLVGEIRPDGPLVQGGTGRNRPPRGPSAPFTYTEVTRLRSYTEVTRLPGARMAFTHALEPHGATTTVTHGLRCEGPLTGLYRLVLGRRFAAGFPVALDGLARLAEAGPPPERP